MARHKSKSKKPRVQSSYQKRIKEFRSQVSALKKAGLISAKIDARKAKPTAALNRDIKKFIDVISGEAKALKLTLKRAKEYRDQGYKTRGSRIILPANVMPRVVKTGKRKGLIQTSRPIAKGTYLHATAFSVNANNLEGFIATLRDDPDWHLQPGEFWAFRFYGWNSSQVFENLNKLQSFIEHYQTFAGSPGKNPTNDELAEAIRNLEIVKISGERAEGWYEENEEFKKEQRRKRVKVRKLYEGHKQENPVSRSIRMQKDRDYHRTHYDKVKERHKKRKQRANRKK